MTPKGAFDAAMARAGHLLRLYDFVCDTRLRGIRGDWATNFKALMRWPHGEAIVRIDGKDRHSMLILRASCGVEREHFAHAYCSELLRSAVVASISALDRMLHDQVVKHCWKLLTKAEANIPKALKTLSLSAVDARKAVEHIRKDPKARPGNLIKKAIQERLHRDCTFQNPDGVSHAASLLGIKRFWEKLAVKLADGSSVESIRKKLSEVAARRNQIVHEADLIRTSRKDPTLREISYTEAAGWVSWMNAFGNAADAVISDELLND